MTTTTRAKFENQIATGEIYDCQDNAIGEQILSFIETEIKEARQEGREEMRKDCVEAINKRIEEMDKDFDRNQPFIAEAHGISDLVSSLK